MGTEEHPKASLAQEIESCGQNHQLESGLHAHSHIACTDGDVQAEVDLPLLAWSNRDQAELKPHLEALLDAASFFSQSVTNAIEQNGDLRAAVERTSTVQRHQQLMEEHLISLVTQGPADTGFQVRSRRVGRTHIANGVRPSWYVLLYNTWFAAIHGAEARGADLPPLETMRRLWQWDLSMSLDAYHEGMLSRWNAERGQLEETVTTFRRMANTDPLTGLANRPALAELIDSLALERDNKAILVLLDLDQFKDLNDRMGHPSGDRALTVIGKALAGSVRRSDVVARIGGDEFCLWIPGEFDNNGIWDQLERIVDGLPLRSLGIGVSAGVASYPKEGIEFPELYQVADRRLYNAKRHGKSGAQLPEEQEIRHWST